MQFFHSEDVEMDDDGFQFLGSRLVPPLPMSMPLTQDTEEVTKDILIKEMADTSIDTIREVQVSPRKTRPKARPTVKRVRVDSSELQQSLPKEKMDEPHTAAITKKNEPIIMARSDKDAFFNRSIHTASNSSIHKAHTETLVPASSEAIFTELTTMTQVQIGVEDYVNDTAFVQSAKELNESIREEDHLQDDQPQTLAQLESSPSPDKNRNIETTIDSEEEMDELDSDTDSSESEIDELMSSSEREDTAMTEIDEEPNVGGINLNHSLRIENIAKPKVHSSVHETSQQTRAEIMGESGSGEASSSTTLDKVDNHKEAAQGTSIDSHLSRTICTFDAEQANVFYCFECRDRLHSHSIADETPYTYDRFLEEELESEESDVDLRYFEAGSLHPRLHLMIGRGRIEDDHNRIRSSSYAYLFVAPVEPIAIEENEPPPLANRFSLPYHCEPAPSSDGEIDMSDEEEEAEQVSSSTIHQVPLADLGRIGRDASIQSRPNQAQNLFSNPNFFDFDFLRGYTATTAVSNEYCNE